MNYNSILELFIIIATAISFMRLPDTQGLNNIFDAIFYIPR